MQHDHIKLHACSNTQNSSIYGRENITFLIAELSSKFHSYVSILKGAVWLHPATITEQKKMINVIIIFILLYTIAFIVYIACTYCAVHG